MADPDLRPEPPPSRSRLEDEVLEILTRADRPPTMRERLRHIASDARKPLGRAARFAPSAIAIGPGILLAASFLLAFLGSLVNGPSHLLGFLFGLASFVCLALLWAPRYNTGSGPKRWRGRDLGPTTSNAQWLDDLRDRFRRPPRP